MLLCLALAPAAACKDDPPKKAPSAASESSPSAPASSYSTRGLIKAVSPVDISIHHERIPDFKDRSGEPVGMDSMTMPFGTAPDLATDELEKGKKIEFTFDVDFSRKPMLQITSAEVLPDDTELELSGM